MQAHGFHNILQLELHQPSTRWIRITSWYLSNLTPSASFVVSFPIWKLRENQTIPTHIFMTCQASVTLCSHPHDVSWSLKNPMLPTDNECRYFSEKGSVLAEEVWHWGDTAEVEAGVGCLLLPGSLRPSGRWLWMKSLLSHLSFHLLLFVLEQTDFFFLFQFQFWDLSYSANNFIPNVQSSRISEPSTVPSSITLTLCILQEKKISEKSSYTLKYFKLLWSVHSWIWKAQQVHYLNFKAMLLCYQSSFRNWQGSSTFLNQK